MWQFVQTTQFKKDFKKYANNKKKLLALEVVLSHLCETGTVPEKFKPHPLSGNYKGTLECHVENDFLLIWIDETESTIKLVRLGSHSELFGK